MRSCVFLGCNFSRILFFGVVDCKVSGKFGTFLLDLAERLGLMFAVLVCMLGRRGKAEEVVKSAGPYYWVMLWLG